jgi:hypothetical protein
MFGRKNLPKQNKSKTICQFVESEEYNLFSSPRISEGVEGNTEELENIDEAPPKLNSRTVTSYCFKTLTREERALIQDPKFKKETPKVGKYNPKYSLIKKKVRDVRFKCKRYSLERR